MQETDSWTSQFQKSIRSFSELEAYFDISLNRKIETQYPVFIPLRIAKKIKEMGIESPLGKQFIPNEDELDPQGMLDPIGDKEHQKAPQLIHRYRNRALFTPTSVCPILCRYCFRKNELNPNDEIFHSQFDATLQYLSEHPEISEIIFTGGDPLTLSNSKIAFYLNRFSQIKTIKDIRFHTRYPVILPERIDSELLHAFDDFAKKFRTLSLAVHTNHLDEFDPSVIWALEQLAELPIQMLSQTVLLKGINNNAEILYSLFEKLIELKIRPYYLHHPDQVKGGRHFYLSLEEGRGIYAQLRNKLPGWAIPHYVIDIPGGKGKVNAFNPESYQYSGQLIGQQGSIYKLPEP